MSVAEKVVLAKCYFSVFLAHASTALIIGFILFVVGICIYLNSKYHSRQIYIGLLTTIVGIIIFLIIGGAMDNPFYPKSPARTDLLIIKYRHQLPYYQKAYDKAYKESKYVHGIQAYKIDKSGYYAKQKVNKMSRYLKIKKPQKPWLDIKI